MSEGFIPESDLIAPRSFTRSAPACHTCGFWKQCNSPKMPVAGKGKKSILVVGEFPSLEEDESGKLFTDDAGEYFCSAFAKFDVDLRRDCWSTNALICRPPSPRAADSDAIEYCRPNLVSVINERKPKVIILLGDKAVESVLGWLFREDAGGLLRWVGMQIPSQKVNAWICPTYHPSFLLKLESSRRDALPKMMFHRHLELAFSLNSCPWKNVPDYSKKIKLEYNNEAVANILKKMIVLRSPVSFDYETTTLKPDSKHARIICCSVSDGKTTIAYPWTEPNAKITSELLKADNPKYGWNMAFEERWTSRVLGHRVNNWQWDGMLGAHIADNRRGVSGLKFQAFIKLGVEPYDDAVKPFLSSQSSNTLNRAAEEVSIDKLLKYCALDSILEHKLCEMQQEEINGA